MALSWTEQSSESRSRIEENEHIEFRRRVSILQLDVEKYEQQALQGALSTIRRCRPLLVLETLPADASWFAEKILSLGYVEIAALDKNLAFAARGSDTGC